LPTIFEVSRVVVEAKGVKSIFLKGSFPSRPGQFVMVWLPGIEEKPMAISETTKDEFAFCYHTVGKFTKACDKLKKGDKVGIRGPYGNSFTIDKKTVVVAGGIGISSVATAIDAIKNPIIIHGARDENHLVYQRRFKDMIITTDDGSAGKRGFVTDALAEVLEKNKDIKLVICCGPEVMIVNVLKVCEHYNIECEAALERYMKCGFGICGNCLVDDKILCIDGPIFASKTLKRMEELGKFARLKTGKKVTLKEYYAQ
jgi:dihydroorotate dehydrogenase electron transfer subunit